MKKIFLLAAIVAVALTGPAFGQIAFNTTGAPADSSAVLDLSSTNKGFLPPRMTTAQRAAIARPALGLMVYNTDFNCLEYYHADGWYNLCGQPSCTFPPAAPGSIAGTVDPVDGSKEQVYAITKVNGATSYNWTVPFGWAITAGQGTDSIWVTVGVAGQSGNISVTAQNLCGISSGQSIKVSPFRCGSAYKDHRDSVAYNTVRIGEQCWFGENLKYLPHVAAPDNSPDRPQYYVYQYAGTDVKKAKAHENYSRYGVLYNWAAAVQGSTIGGEHEGRVQGICPEGTHLPDDKEWRALENALGMCPDIGTECSGANGWRGTTEGGQLKSTDMGGPNSSGFTALAGGVVKGAAFDNTGGSAYFWTATAYGQDKAYGRALAMNESTIFRAAEMRAWGMSVRCLKD